MPGVPRNHWYVAALATEITPEPMARRILGEDIVFYRLSSGVPVALRDRCAHHLYPLSLGKLVDDILVCNYHGFSFDCRGDCVAVPGQSRIPPKARVRAYELVEQGQWVWIWAGDEPPGDRRPPSTPWIDALDGWTAHSGVATLDCRHSLLVDNLLDLSHETYLHGGYIGTPDVAATPIHTAVDRARGVVSVSRHMVAAECPAFYARTTGLSSPIDRWQDLEFFAPSYYQLHVRIAPTGLPVDAAPGDAGAFHAKILYGLTPADEDHTHDFWAVCRDFATEDAEVTTYMDAMQREIVQQDVDALNALEQRLSAEREPFEVGVAIDRGAFAARRLIADQAASEHAAGDARSVLATIGDLAAR